MSLVMKWQQSEIALYRTNPSGEPVEETPVSRIELAFELLPNSLLLAEDRHRLLAAMQQLRTSSGADEILVDLFLPAFWGVTHRIPNPNLREDELEEHLRWEISKALTDTENQFRFSFGFDADNSITIAAIRLPLVDAILRLTSESSFHVQGIYLDSEPFQRINLIGKPPEPPLISETVPVAEEKPHRRVHIEDEVEGIPKLRRAPTPKFFTWVLIFGILIVAYFAYIKLNRPKKATFIPTRETIAKLEEATKPPPDSTLSDSLRISTIPPPVDTVKQASDTTSASPTPNSSSAATTAISTNGRWMDMPRRLEVARPVLELMNGSVHLDLMSFTADRFLCQLTSLDTLLLGKAIDQIRKLENLADARVTQQAVQGGGYRRVFTARMLTSINESTLKLPDKNKVIELGKKHGLSHRELVFTGPKDNMLAFLADVCAEQYKVYRLILVPWEVQDLRAVLEL
jgi:hypothetical protein